MDLRQRVVRRSPFVIWTLNTLLFIAVLLFVHMVVRQNMTGRKLQVWPWSWQLLDAQSATAALLASVGAVIARAQYARTVRPLLGHTAWVTADTAPGGDLAWTGFLTNSGHDAVVVQSVHYRVDFVDTGDPLSPRTTGWVPLAAVVAAAESRGLRTGQDYRFTSLGPNGVCPAGSRLRLAWFTEAALAVMADVYVRVTVLDRVGDLHQRTVSCLIDADRVLTHAMPSPI
ncbi:hypothetical protein [Kitasatospora sp. NPDC004289]